MNFTISCLFYLLIGAGVSTALFLEDRQLSVGDRLFRSLTGFLFWPLYLPMLLQPGGNDEALEIQSAKASAPQDDLERAISQVENELEAAFHSLDGWAEMALSHAGERFEELRMAWRAQADRIREMDQLLLQPEFQKVIPQTDETGTRRSQKSDAARRENIQRLKQIRGKIHEDLLGTLAWVRELVTMIHLAKFTGAPASRAEELIAQIAATIEGLSEVTQWNGNQPAITDSQNSGTNSRFKATTRPATNVRQVPEGDPERYVAAAGRKAGS